jgi:hypothetical protein
MLAVPLATGGPLHSTLHAEHAWIDILGWLGYAMFLWSFVVLCVGFDKLLQWLAIGIAFGLTLVFGGAIVGKLGVWELLHNTIGVVLPPGSRDPVQRDLDLIFRLIMVATSLPYLLLVLHSFPAAEVFTAAVRQGTRSRAKTLVSVAVFLRLFQHVFELFTTFLTAWQEENPQMVVPRHNRAFYDGIKGSLRTGSWAKDSIGVWCLALLSHSFLFVPVVVRDWQAFLDQEGDRQPRSRR